MTTPFLASQLLRRVMPLGLVLAALLAGSAQAQPFNAWFTMTGASSGYVRVPTAPELNPSTAFTFEAWVAVTDTHSCSSIAGKNWQAAWWVGLCGNTLRSYLKGGLSSQKNGGTVQSGQWTHIAVVYDGSTRKHYINGELAVSFPETGTLPATGDELRIGSDVQWQYTPAGSIDEVRLWNVARTQDQIRQSINKTLTLPQTGLVGYWKLDASTADSSGQGNSGTTQGAGTGFISFPAGPHCTTTTTSSLCLLNRFQITTQYRTNPPGTPPNGNGSVVVANAGSGLFWFFNVNSWEVMVKAIDGCGFNDRFWIYSAASTDVFYRMNVYDTVANQNKVYFNYPGAPAPAVTDSDAFATCP